VGRALRVGLAGLLGLALTACGAPAQAPPPPRAPTTTASTVPTPNAPAPSSVDSHAPAGFVALSDVDSTIQQDIRYATPHNFVGRPIAGYREPLCILTRTAADALHRVQMAARARGYGLKTYDCYRPQRAVDEFVDWAKHLDDQTMKAEFYPTVPKADLFADGYIGAPTAHSRGSTLDLTLVALPVRPQRGYVPGEPLRPCTAPVGQRFPDNSVDMGTGFDCFDPLAHTLDPHITGPARANRLLLKDLMAGAGFVNYPNEWWHYSLADAPYPHTYFDFPVSRAAVGP
jgi:zinc D-Ala-D-Ala dipeptidase